MRPVSPLYALIAHVSSPLFAPPPARSGTMGFTKTDGWLAGPESDALPHDKTPGFGDGAPRTTIPCLISTGVL